MSPFSAVSVLHLFSKRAIPLTRAVFDDAWDSLTSLLEKANNETYRLSDTPEVHPEVQDESE